MPSPNVSHADRLLVAASRNQSRTMDSSHCQSTKTSIAENTSCNPRSGDCCFFLLPPELRLIVYADVVSTFDIDLKRTDAGCRTFEPPLLQSNTAIRNEAMRAYYDRLESLLDEAETERYAATVRLLSVLNKKLEFVVPWELQYALSEDDAAIRRFDKLAVMVELERDKMAAEGFPIPRWDGRRKSKTNERGLRNTIGATVDVL